MLLSSLSCANNWIWPSPLATFFIAPTNCIFRGASFEPEVAGNIGVIYIGVIYPSLPPFLPLSLFLSLSLSFFLFFHCSRRIFWLKTWQLGPLKSYKVFMETSCTIVTPYRHRWWRHFLGHPFFLSFCLSFWFKTLDSKSHNLQKTAGMGWLRVVGSLKL